MKIKIFLRLLGIGVMAFFVACDAITATKAFYDGETAKMWLFIGVGAVWAICCVLTCVLTLHNIIKMFKGAHNKES